jgi:hypothetical protein
LKATFEQLSTLATFPTLATLPTFPTFERLSPRGRVAFLMAVPVRSWAAVLPVIPSWRADNIAHNRPILPCMAFLLFHGVRMHLKKKSP